MTQGADATPDGASAWRSAGRIAALAALLAASGPALAQPSDRPIEICVDHRGGYVGSIDIDAFQRAGLPVIKLSTRTNFLLGQRQCVTAPAGVLGVRVSAYSDTGFSVAHACPISLFPVTPATITMRGTSFHPYCTR
ncbi:hypothetical protein [Falsiroseomonas tokyonensis]|uniref:Uncharacterized protein n=1 Tax=Falsiroseomonas tokyonensis TaxID=430521 RepID=A0ABV7BXL1_9PROT|nr:hypothetical protein [Falsiroseomonas tokyonensis]MBU8540268.1 hypothetical protein [Falsiroseomonas tokyonensis]